MSTVPLSTDHRAGVDVLYRTYRQDVYRSLLRDLGNPADADDGTQTVFLSAMRALERGCRPRAARAWLLAIAKNVARKKWRERAQPAVELDEQSVSAVDGADARRELFAVLEELPAAQRTALVLHELYGLDYAEISELTDQSQAGIETAVFRARRTVRTAMRDGGVLEHEAASKLLRRLVDGKLTRNEREAVAAHLRGCPDCATAEAALRDGKGRGRSRIVLWLLSVPSALQRLVGLFQASPARGLGALGACALGLAGMAGDRPTDAGPARAPVATPVVVAEPSVRPVAAAAPLPAAARRARPAPAERRAATISSGAITHPSRPRPIPVKRTRPVATPPATVAPRPESRAPAVEPRRTSSAPEEAHAARAPKENVTKPVTGVVQSLPIPIAGEPPLDVERTVGGVVDVVREAASGDLAGAGAAVDATVGGVLEDAGLPAPPPLAEPLTGTVEGLTGTVTTTAADIVPPLGR